MKSCTSAWRDDLQRSSGNVDAMWSQIEHANSMLSCFTKPICWRSDPDTITVRHLEKMKTESVFGQKYVVWDVHASDGRWWVITGPTNLYSQTEFPSLDYLLSFHVGLMARIASRDTRKAGTANQNRFAAAWRRWEQAASAIDNASEAEAFQAVGMKCRECLLVSTPI